MPKRIAKTVLAIVVKDECPTMEDHHQECEVRDRYNAWPEHYRDPIAAMLALTLARNAAQDEWRKQAIEKCSKENNEIEQILGEHVPASLVREAANRLAAMDDVLVECRPIVQQRYDAWAALHFSPEIVRRKKERDDELARCESLLSRIDALTAKGAGP